MRTIRGLTVLGLALVMMGHTPGAWACSCPVLTPQSSFRSADVVFIGSVVAREDPNTGDVQSSADPISWTFDVQSVQKGGAGGSETITSVRDSATCGFEFTVGKRYQVFADRSSSGLTTDICAGTVGLAAGEPGFHVQAGRLSKTGPAPGMALPLLGAFMAVCGAVLARTARKRAYFTWPR